MGEPNRNTVADAILADRARTGLSARKLAEQIGVSHPTLLALSKGTADIQLRTLWLLADRYGWDLSEVGQAAMTCEPPPKKSKKKKHSTAISK